MGIPELTKISEDRTFTNWRFGKYRVTTYPDSNLVYIVLAQKTHKRVIGHKIESAFRIARAALEKVKL